MPTVIDSLVLEFNLDPTKFNTAQDELMRRMRDLEERARRAGSETETSTTKMVDGFMLLKRQALGVAGALLMGREVVSFTEYITKLDQRTGQMAARFGMATKEMGVWQAMVKTVGGSADSANSAFMSMNSQLERFNQTGQAAQELGILSTLGLTQLSRRGPSGKAEAVTAEDAFMQLARGIEQRIAAGTITRRAAAERLSMAGIPMDMINLILLGSKELEKRRASLEKLTALSERDVQLANDRMEAYTKATQASDSLGRSLLNVFTPAAEKAGSVLAKIFSIIGARAEKFMDEHPGVFGKGGTWSPPEKSILGRLFKWAGIGTEKGGATFNERFTFNDAGAPGGNWHKFLGGLAYLESGFDPGARNPGSSATGAFQFTAGTAADALKSGIADPRFGSYEDQERATMAFIKKWHPEAAAAIEAGKFGTAIPMLTGRWPSLPGGSQQQNPKRYENFQQYLRGEKTAPGGKNVTVNMGGTTINMYGGDAQSVANAVVPHTKRAVAAGLANSAFG